MTENFQEDQSSGDIFENQDESDDNTMGGRIWQARETAGLSVEELARHIGVSGDILTDWESDRSEPRTNRLVMLAGFLNVSPTWLLIGQGEEPTTFASGDDNSIQSHHIRAELRTLRARFLALGTAIDRIETILDENDAQ